MFDNVSFTLFAVFGFYLRRKFFDRYKGDIDCFRIFVNYYSELKIFRIQFFSFVFLVFAVNSFMLLNWTPILQDFVVDRHYSGNFFRYVWSLNSDFRQVDVAFNRIFKLRGTIRARFHFQQQSAKLFLEKKEYLCTGKTKMQILKDKNA